MTFVMIFMCGGHIGRSRVVHRVPVNPQVLTKNEGFSDFCEGWVPFLLEIKQKAGWLVGMCEVHENNCLIAYQHSYTMACH